MEQGVNNGRNKGRTAVLPLLFFSQDLLLLDGQNAHGACLGADAAGDALAGSGSLGSHDHDMHGAGLDALAAANTLLLVDHVHTLGVLGDSTLGAGTGALAAHDAVHDLGLVIGLGDDADAAEIRIELLIERLGAGNDTAQTSLAGVLFTDN